MGFLAGIAMPLDLSARKLWGIVATCYVLLASVERYGWSTAYLVFGVHH